MNIHSHDEVIEELWKIKDQFAVSSRGDIHELVSRANEIAKRKGFQNTVENTSNPEAGISKS